MMNLPLSNSEGASDFELLDERIKRWIWEKGWTGLRDAQQRAIRPILAGDRDVIIAAATAAGKTEAAFLPILTRLAQLGEESGLAIYISPLKALINDQWGRLDQLCDALELPVTPWHGDINAAKKQRFINHPRGVLLITPESLEALFVRRGSAIARVFAETSHVVIDELHAFIGSDRGKQMQSLLSRIEGAAERKLSRIGLSATLGDMRMAAEYLRPNGGDQVELIVSKETGHSLRLQVRGYVVPLHPHNDPKSDPAEQAASAKEAIADHLYKTLHNSNNLIFPNSRSSVEFYTDALRRRCEQNGGPAIFWPHHGSLSRNIREETEQALKDGSRHATAICTNTLELGIDIGAVRSVAQIGPAPSVAALRQRLGRSGRRPGEAAVLRAYAVEQELGPHSDYSDRLREALVQSIAMIHLLGRGWFEPPNSKGLHLSTMVQQILSIIAERGGAIARQLYDDLVVRGAFGGLTPAEFGSLLRALAAHDLIVQEKSGLLLLGQKGERLVDSYDFYAAFASEDEWQIVHEGRIMGSLPISSPITLGMRIIFAGRRWLVTGVDAEAQIISVRTDPGGTPPAFDSGRALVHDKVREEMREILRSTEIVEFLDAPASALLEEARTHYKLLELDRQRWLAHGASVCLFPWAGDIGNNTLVLLLRGLGFRQVNNEGLTVVATHCDSDRLLDALSDIAALPDTDLDSYLTDVSNLKSGKWDWALPEPLLKQSYASSNLSFESARRIAAGLLAN